MEKLKSTPPKSNGNGIEWNYRTLARHQFRSRLDHAFLQAVPDRLKFLCVPHNRYYCLIEQIHPFQQMNHTNQDKRSLNTQTHIRII